MSGHCVTKVNFVCSNFINLSYFIILVVFHIQLVISSLAAILWN